MIFVTETIASYWSSWQSWSPCSKTCGKRVKRRKRVCIGSNHGGCRGPKMEKVECGKGGDDDDDEDDDDDDDGCSDD